MRTLLSTRGKRVEWNMVFEWFPLVELYSTSCEMHLDVDSDNPSRNRNTTRNFGYLLREAVHF
jgi:hypothetical protein